MSDAVEIDELMRRLDAAKSALAKHAAVEEALRASEQKYKAAFEAQARLAALDSDRSRYEKLFETIDDGFSVVECFLDENGQVVDWLWLEVNRAFETLSTLGDVVGKRASELLPGFADNAASLGRAIATGKTIRSEGDYSPGIDRWFRAHFARVGGEESRIVAVRFEDTTRKRAEAALRESEARHRILVESWSQAVWETDAAGVVTVDSPSWRAYTGQTYEEWLGDGWLNAIHPDDRTFAERQWRDAIAARALVNAEFRLHAPDGGWRWTNVLAAPVLDADGNIEKWAGLNIDVDTRVRAEQALRQSEEQFRRFAASSSDILWIRDADTLTLEFLSDATRDIYGVDAEMLLGDQARNIAMIVPEDREDVFGAIARVQSGMSVVHDYRIQRVDGTFRWMRSTSFPLVSHGSTIQKIRGISADVTEMKLATEHQAVLIHELQHRVRNIMAIVKSMASRSADSVSDVAEYRTRLEGRLMALARVQTLLTREANAGGWLHEILDSEIAAQAHHRGQYVLDGPDVRLSPKAVEVLTLAFHELATNAVKYGALSVIDGTLRVGWTRFEKRGREWLAIKWTEDGAPPRPPSTRRGFGSELIEARIPYELRGRGEVTIGPGGAHCLLEFPLGEGESILETDAPERTKVFGGMLDMTNAPDLSGRRVLVVEDDYYLASDAAAALRGAGAEVLGPCPDAQTTFDLLERTAPTHAVLDLNLGGGGPKFDLARTLQARGVPIIFLTGYDPEVIPAEMTEVVRLQKPTPMLTLVEAVSRL